MRGDSVVCQLPGCTTTQKELEEAFGQYVSDFCTKCEKKRDGSLCGCPFPCSLTFKGMMLEKIFQLLQKEIPTGMKTIQVCYKHSDLLKMAREVSIMSRDSILPMNPKIIPIIPITYPKNNSPLPPKSVIVPAANQPGSSKAVNISLDSIIESQVVATAVTAAASESHPQNPPPKSVIQEVEASSATPVVFESPQTVTSLSESAESALGPLKEMRINKTAASSLSTEHFLSDSQSHRDFSSLKTIEISEDSAVVGLASSILSDKSNVDEFFKIPVNEMLEPRGTGLPYQVGEVEDSGQLVYSADDHNSIIIQGVAEDGAVSTKSSRVMKIQLADMPTLLLNDIVADTRTIDESTSNEISYSLNDALDDTRALSKSDEGDESRKRPFSSTDILEPATNSINIQQIKRRKNPKPSKSLRNPTVKRIEGGLNFDAEKSFDKVGEEEEEMNINLVRSVVEEPKDTTVKIMCKVSDKMIPTELPNLMNLPKLCDLVFYCIDGQVYSSSMILASVSEFLKDLMFSIPRIDSHRTFILPSEFTTSQVELLNKILYQELNLEDMDLDDLFSIQSLAHTLHIQSIIQLYEARIYSTQSIIHFDLDPVVSSANDGGNHDTGEEEGGVMQHQAGDNTLPLHPSNKDGREGDERALSENASVGAPAMVLIDENGELKFRSANEREKLSHERLQLVHDTGGGQSHVHHGIGDQAQVQPGGEGQGQVQPEPGGQNIIQAALGTGRRIGSSLGLGIVRVDKNDLNPDYLDENGIVRLDTRLEMPIHYCIVCDAKFKKYKQAITHYAGMHMLTARLACDSCDELFDDMFTCNKHKYEDHGGFDRNLQCYLCKTVSYSRQRLKTHIKDNHYEVYGEYQCKICCMKFAAEFYLTEHHQLTHTQESSTNCGICGKHFRGKRYLTMHMKSVHETGNKFDHKCKTCGEPFQSRKHLAFHRARMHNDPDKSILETCHLCPKYFKTKTELKNHLAKKHK